MQTNFVCDVCNKSWDTKQAMAIHRSWHFKKRTNRKQYTPTTPTRITTLCKRLSEILPVGSSITIQGIRVDG
jgi:hypothetical protein